MKKLPEPNHGFNLEAPSYEEVTRIVRKIRSSGSPCPIDHESIIVFKKCPVLRTQLRRILRKCWNEGSVPTIWKKGITVLAHKKGPANQPENFRPITLEPVLLKVFTALIRNRLFEFVSKNSFIESDIQKGFWSNISGSVEHLETLTNIMRHSKRKQRQLVVTLLDLKNAFGEVHHNLLPSVLRYHHVPDACIELISELYKDFSVSIASNDFVTMPIPVERGVLQGDSLSPLLFNLCVNTLINTIKDEKGGLYGIRL